MRPITSLLVFGLLLPPARGLTQTRAGTVNVGDAEINYELTGAPGAKTIVFIHGWALSLAAWDDQVRAFSPHYRVLRYDLRGFGKSTGHADPTAEPDDLRILLDSLGIRTAYLAGLSRGARVVRDFVAAFPERVDALVLYGAGPMPGFPVPPELRPQFSAASLAEIAQKYGMDSIRKFVAASEIAWKPPGRPDLEERSRRTMAAYEGRDLLDPRPPSGRVPPATIDQLGKIRVPTLVIYGDHERALGKMVADTLMRRIPNARRVIIKDGGHGAHAAQPEQFNKALMAFFKEVDGRR